ncbi:hypothetical protein FRC03_006632 [Tulasnella sp. 419]|nr:hypothetical protein FRC03_006632 [Tulasnella sp. 419]
MDGEAGPNLVTLIFCSTTPSIHKMVLSIMIASLLTSAFLSAISVIAQSANYAKCLLDCASPSAQSAGCVSFATPECLCGNSVFQSTNAECMKSSCSPEDAQKFQSYQQSYCEGVPSDWIVPSSTGILTQSSRSTTSTPRSHPSTTPGLPTTRTLSYSTPTTSRPGPSSSYVPLASSREPFPVGAIIGIVIGGIAALFVVVWIIYVGKQRSWIAKSKLALQHLLDRLMFV